MPLVTSRQPPVCLHIAKALTNHLLYSKYNTVHPYIHHASGVPMTVSNVGGVTVVMGHVLQVRVWMAQCKPPHC